MHMGLHPSYAYTGGISRHAHTLHPSLSPHSIIQPSCLLQGEIIVATLLFVILVKDWQLWKNMCPSVSKFEDTDRNMLIPMKQTQVHIFEPLTLMHIRRLGFDKSNPWLPYPDKKILQSILNDINYHILSRDSQDRVRLRSIESLTILAALLHD